MGAFFKPIPKKGLGEDYSDIEELRALREEWKHLTNQLRIQILEEFELLEKGIKQEDMLHDACIAIDAMGD